MNKPRITAIAGMLVVAIMLSLLTTYFYGKTFSHPRYWDGTIERVVTRQVEFIEMVVNEFNSTKSFPRELPRIDKLFTPFKGKFIVELSEGEKVIWSNVNPGYGRGALVKKLDLLDGRRMVISRYTAPIWSSVFWRWLSSPDRWLEPSYDHITMPFIWFLLIHFVFLISIAMTITANYLKRDVLSLFQRIEGRLGS